MSKFYTSFICLGLFLFFGITELHAHAEEPFNEISENEWSECNGQQIAYWSLDNCVSFGNDGTNYDYSELTAVTNTPSGFNAVNATNLTSNGPHSCVYGQSGAGFCHGTRTSCNWVDNDNDAITFTVTVNPQNGYSACITKLRFYESAPHSFLHLSGNSGDNDPPAKYGFRVLKNGQEIFQTTGHNTSENWSQENYDFGSDPDFTVTSNTVFKFELLGYCRQGSNGLAAWDLDEIKVFGCATQNDPCAGLGGDSDGDGICNNQDCQPNNPNFPANPGTACNDGNPDTSNDMVTSDGCGCAGTPVGPPCDVTVNGCSIMITGLDAGDYSKVFDSNWNIVWDCNPWGNNVCSSPATITDLSDGTYYVQACGETTAYEVSGCAPVDPCAGQGGDSDGDGVCNNQDCHPNNPNFPATPGSACNDGNPNTTNDMVTSDGCGCAGTPVNPCAGQGGDSDGDGVCNNQDCHPNNPNFPAAPGSACNDGNPNTNNDMVTSDGCGCEGTPVGSPCTVMADDCTITISGLDGGDYSKIFDSNWNVIWNCNPWGNDICNATEVINNLSNGTYYVEACGETTTFVITGCSPIPPCANQGGDSDGDGFCNQSDCQPNNPNFPATPGTPCNDGNPNTTNDMVTSDGCGCEGTSVNPCAGQGGDSDGDGVCDNQDCHPNNPNFPAAPGSSCNDGNSNTVNDIVTSDGCGCEGTPVGPACNVVVNGCSITITGLDAGDYAKVFDSNWNIVWDCNPWGNNVCSSSETITDLSDGTYYVQACGETTAYEVSGCTPVDPCAGQGGDSDGDGVCNNQDCQPNNPSFPATPGSACNDGNPNTTNDMVTSDGCGCAGTPVGPACNVTVNGCSITITGLDAGDYSKVFDSNWNIVWDCNPWGNNVCSSTETITDLSDGTYFVQACGETTAYAVSGCAPVDPCAGQGGDSDGDGVCNNQDCQPNNPNFPATPGSSCNDGNPNTENDMVTSDGCACEGTPVVPNPCNSVTSLRRVKNLASSCDAQSQGPRVIWIEGVYYKEIGDLYFVEFNNGTANLKGRVKKLNGSTILNVDVDFSGKTNNADPYLEFCADASQSSNWYYYTNFSGTIGNTNISPRGNFDFQIGFGASAMNSNYGASGWFNYGNDDGDFNFDLSGQLNCTDNNNNGVIDVCESSGSSQQSVALDDLIFTAKKDGPNVDLLWTTNTDYKSNYYELEHSADGINFELINEVMSNSNSDAFINYKKQDANAIVGLNYYRVKQVFEDGTFGYSAIRKVAFDTAANKFSIYPNPTMEDVFINLKDYVGNSGSLFIYNSLGHMVYAKRLELITEESVRISTADMISGVHAVTVQVDNRKVMTELLIISK